jgi:transposase-like protein
VRDVLGDPVALRQAYADRNAAVRAAAAANPGLPVAALARALGLHPSTVRAALR